MAIRQAGGKVFFEQAGRLVDNLVLPGTPYIIRDSDEISW